MESIENLSNHIDIKPSVKDQLITQINYYFSRKNISTDVYLVNHMNSSLFVPISVVANFAKIKALTEDMQVLLDAMKSSDQVVVDEQEMKVRPVFKLQRNTLILRDIPSDADIEVVQQLLTDASVPHIKSIRPDIGNNWFVTMENEDEAKLMFDYIRTLTWEGNPIPVRIKSENLLKSVHEREAQLEINQEAAKADVKLPPGYIAPTENVNSTVEGSVTSAPYPVNSIIPPSPYYYPPAAVGPSGEIYYPTTPYGYPPEYANNPRYFPGFSPMMPGHYPMTGQWRPGNRRAPYHYQNGGSPGYPGNHGSRNNRPRNHHSSQPDGEFVKDIVEQENTLVDSNHSDRKSAEPSQQRTSHASYQSGHRMRSSHASSGYSANSNHNGNRHSRNIPRHQAHHRRSSQSSYVPLTPDSFPALSPSPQPATSQMVPTKAYAVVAAESASRDHSPLLVATVSTTDSASQTKSASNFKKYTNQEISPTYKKPLRPVKPNMMQEELNLANDLIPVMESTSISSNAASTEFHSDMPSKDSSPKSKSFSYADAVRKPAIRKDDAGTLTSVAAASSSNPIMSSKEIKA